MLCGLYNRLGQPSSQKDFTDRRKLLMRRHSFKISPNRIFFIADSQLWKDVYPNINIFSMCGRISDVLNHLPRKNQYDTIVLFIGANDLFQKNGTTSFRSPNSVAEELNQLGNPYADCAKKVCIFALPPRHHLPERTKAANEVLASTKSSNWDYSGGISKHIYSKQHISPGDDDMHLTEVALVGFKKLLKDKVLYKMFSSAVHAAGHPNEYNCETV